MIGIQDLIEVTLAQTDDFLKVRETLTRIGVASKKEKTLYQSCHILHKQGKYYIVHFKELFALDGKPTDLTDNDLSRRNAIVKLLQDWGLVQIVNPKSIETPEPIFISQIKILSHKEKGEWQLVPKYNIGKKPQTA
jgi:Bacteriophage translational regulator